MNEQENNIRSSCPKCGSANIQFKRETQGEIRSKKSKQVIHRTVGFCKDCGYTWFPNQKRRKTWLWVLGWLFIFPLPLTILLLRKKSMNSVLKFGIIAVAWALYLLIAVSGKNSSSQHQESTPVQAVETEAAAEPTVMPTAEPTPEADPEAALRDAFNASIGGSGLTFYKSVRNDTTGRWRCAVIYTGENMVDHALEYYKAYFESDDELHFVCNLGLKTTTALRVVLGNLQVDVHEYVDGEEHDAKILNSGALLGSYWVNLETGAVEALEG